MTKLPEAEEALGFGAMQTTSHIIEGFASTACTMHETMQDNLVGSVQGLAWHEVLALGLPKIRLG